MEQASPMDTPIQRQSDSSYKDLFDAGLVPITFGDKAGTWAPAEGSVLLSGGFGRDAQPPHDDDHYDKDWLSTSSHLIARSEPNEGRVFSRFISQLGEKMIHDIRASGLAPTDFYVQAGGHLAVTAEALPYYRELRTKMIEVGHGNVIHTLENEGNSRSVTLMTTAPHPQDEIPHVAEELIARPDRGFDVQTILHFDACLGMLLVDDGAIHSPMTVTRHEIEHAYDYRLVALGKLSINTLEKWNSDYGNVAEKRACAAENDFARLIGERGFRAAYTGVRPRKTAGFTSTVAVNPPSFFRKVSDLLLDIQDFGELA